MVRSRLQVWAPLDVVALPPTLSLLLSTQFGQQDGPSVQLVGEALQGGRHRGHHRRVVRIGASFVFLFFLRF